MVLSPTVTLLRRVVCVSLSYVTKFFLKFALERAKESYNTAAEFGREELHCRSVCSINYYSGYLPQFHET